MTDAKIFNTFIFAACIKSTASSLYLTFIGVINFNERRSEAKGRDGAATQKSTGKVQTEGIALLLGYRMKQNTDFDCSFHLNSLREGHF